MYVMNEYLSHLFNSSSINENQIDCRCLHHQANLEMGHLLTHSGLKHPEVSLTFKGRMLHICHAACIPWWLAVTYM